MTLKAALDMLQGSHDLRLSRWGPYTKRYMGISHIPDIEAGLRFDVSVFPALYRRGVQPPNVLWESGYHPWEASPDLAYFRHRHELVWRDRVYADIDFCRLDDEATLVRTACVNATDNPQNLALHWMASLHFPPLGGRGSGWLRMARPTLPVGAVWVEALSYRALSLSHQAHRANLSYDGLIRGEVRVSGFVDGLGLGQGFGLNLGDAATYRLELPTPLLDPVLVIRYRLAEGERIELDLPGLFAERVRLRGTGSCATREVSLDRMLTGEVIFTVAPAKPGVPVELDGFALVPAASLHQLRFETVDWNPVPERLPSGGDTLILRYDDVEPVYGLAWGGGDGVPVPSQVREFICDDLDRTMRTYVHEHVREVILGDDAESPDAGHYTNVFQRPIILAPNAEQVHYGLICAGDLETVRRRLAEFDPADPHWEQVHAEARRRAVTFEQGRGLNPGGEPYRFSQTRMAATLLTNVVYPVRTRGSWIRHYTPGRWWDSLYTWDSGFIGLGLAELDPDRALDNLNAYLTEAGTEDAAFIHHGTPLPTQFYVFLALWNQCQEQSLLETFYPRLQQYHRFLAGRLGSSTTRDLKSNLIRTWDYFYNSGGWDDYPPQWHVRRQGLQRVVAPVVSTSHVIRTAKILRMMAEALGEPTAEYERDITVLSDALHTHAWDEEAGYFGYVIHDEEGQPTGILRHESGANFNMGIDGASPLVAGACTPEQEARLVTALMSDTQMWSPCGLSTVDQSAPYYRDDGYWNGGVWMPHQWFFWKALLDLGRAEEAHRIARTALEVWQREVERSYNCFEHFIVRTGRGAGWHHFGGLSTPVLAWFGAYHRPGRLTVGFDIWIASLEIGPGQATAWGEGAGNAASGDLALRAELRHFGPAHHAPVVIATLVPGAYEVTWDGESVTPNERYPGTLEIRLPPGPWAGTLQIVRA
ncbi:MAG: MGH1-like glycoside hydrolase domain-containing protein [Anaerolineae bacterium]